MIIMIDIRQSHGEQAVQILNNEFGRKRAVFLHCDVTNNSEFDCKYIHICKNKRFIYKKITR